MGTRAIQGGARSAPGQALVRRFTLISLALTLFATTATIYAMGWVVETYLLGQAALEEHRRLDRRVLPLVPSGGFGSSLAGADRAALDAVVREHLVAPPVRRVALRGESGELLYESGPSGTGAPREHVAAALAGHARRQVAAGPDGARELRLLEPLVRDGAVVGVYEVDHDYEPLALHVREMQLFAGVSIGAFSALLYLLLYRLVRGAARDLAAEAVANARLFEEVQRSSAVASALLHTAEALARLVPPDQLLEDVASRAVALLGADDALVFLRDDDGERFVLRASSGVPPEKLAAFPLHTVEPASFPAFARLCAGEGPVVVEDAPTSDLLPPGLAEWYGARSCVFAPLDVGSRHEGAMVVHFNRAAHRFTPEELRLATGLAGQAAVAIANSRAVETVGEVEALREANQVRSQLVSVVTHELRSPLSVVLGFAELLSIDGALPPGARDMAGKIHGEAERLNLLVDDLLDLGRLESGRFALAREPVDLAELARETADRLAPGAPRHAITVEADDRPAVALADRSRLRQVLDNLVGNAIRYSPDGGPVRLRVGGDGRRAFVAVEDEGLGIAPEDLRRLFERFYRSGRPEVRRIKGTGLGLAITQAIVAAHGGTIRVESDGPGRGSAFTAELPAAEAGAGHADAPALAWTAA